LTGWSSIGQPSNLYKEPIVFSTKHAATNYCAHYGLDIVDTGIESLTQRHGSTIISGALRKELKPSIGQPSNLYKEPIVFSTKHAATNYCAHYGLDIVDTGIESLTQRHGSTIISGALRKELKPKSYGDNFSVHRKGLPIWPPV
jgi:nitrite reductase/ring-hydroxylating ferredoxin subunit